MMKKRIAQVVSLVVSMIVVCVLGITCTSDKIQIEDENTPLADGIGILLSEQTEDIAVIPDKYNTGAKGELTPVTSECYISGVKFGTTGEADRKLDLYYQPKDVVIPTEIVVENCDFSSGKFREYNVDKVDKEVTIIYRNCKFKSYIVSGEGLIKRKFDNCTFTHFSGSDAIFNNCYFGGAGTSDGIHPMKNCTFNNCMIADLIQPAQEKGKQHIDGFQIFGNQTGGINENIKFLNCRFEVPYIPMSNPSGLLNCPVTLTMNFSGVNDISISDCYINGGKYYGIMLYAGDYEITNVALSNIKLGENSVYSYTCDSDLKEIVAKNVAKTNSLYVASVWKADDGIHLSVTNDTLQERKLSILTTDGVQEFVVPACFKGNDLAVDTVTYEDFPFDIEIIISSTEWIACFDTTNEVKQVRYVNWGTEDIYVDLDSIFEVDNEQQNDETEVDNEQQNDETELDKDNESNETVVTEEIVQSGTCGAKVEYLLKNGVLNISGEGATYNYHSGKTAPWYDYKESIVEIYVAEGITSIGNQLFVGCKNLKNVHLAEGVETIGSNVFKGCSTIEYVSFPKSIKTVGERSFTGSIQKIKYAGTEAEWETIVFNNYNNGIFSAEISYVSTISSGQCGKTIEWYMTSDGKLVLAGSGKTNDYHSKSTAPWYENRESITEIYISEGITDLGNQLFVGCKNLKNVHLAEGVETIGSNVFKGCSSIEYICFPKSIKTVGERSFAGSIQEVEYTGTETEWQNIVFGKYNSGILNAEKIYVQ